jgi:hypothetical protein
VLVLVADEVEIQCECKGRDAGRRLTGETEATFFGPRLAGSVGTAGYLNSESTAASSPEQIDVAAVMSD